MPAVSSQSFTTTSEGTFAATALDVLEDYLSSCKDACDGEIQRIYSSGQRGSSGLHDLMLDYPLRGGEGPAPRARASRPAARSAASSRRCCRSAAVLELYHNAFLIHDDIEDESIMRRGGPTLHPTHGVPIAVNVGDAMLALSLQPLLDNIGVVGLGPSLRILRRRRPDDPRRRVEGQALELEWVRQGVWDLADEDYVAMVEQKTCWYSFITPMRVGAIAAALAPERMAAPASSRAAWASRSRSRTTS